MLNIIRTFLNDSRGATMIEYGLIAALVAVVLVGVLTTLGGSLSDLFQEVSDQL